MTKLGKILSFCHTFLKARASYFWLLNTKAFFHIFALIISFKLWFVAGIFGFRRWFDVDVLAFFGVATVLATFSKHWATFSVGTLVMFISSSIVTVTATFPLLPKAWNTN